MPEPLDIDVAGATAALEALDAAASAEASPVDAPTPEPETVDAPEGQAPEAPEAEFDTSFTSIPDEALTPELLQMKRSMQADYSRKTMEIAPWRKLGDELGIESPDQFRDAATVYTRLQDPRNWPTIHQELTQYMVDAGMSPRQAQAAASEQLATFTTPDEDPDDGMWSDDDGGSDQQMAPIMQALKQQQAQIEQLTGYISQRDANEAHQAQVRTLAEGLTNMENAVRQQNPTYDQNDIDAIYNLMGEDANLFAAQQKYESIIGHRVAQYIAKKQGALAGAPTPAPGGGVIAEQVDEAPLSMDEAHRRAMAYVNELDKADAQS